MQNNFFSFLNGSEIEEDLNEHLSDDQKQTLQQIVQQNLSLEQLREYLETVDNLDEQ